MAAVAVLSLSGARAAQASYGSVKGTLEFYNMQGNYSASTVGVKYPVSHYNTPRPVRHAVVQVRLCDLLFAFGVAAK